ncbi:MAG: endonuclease domain-containing protein [Gemmatimonadales bacterium]
MRLRRRPTSPRKLQRARELRQDLTLAERRAWDLLRNRRMLGLKFRRQHVLAGFIVDFYCAKLGLVLEINGPGHTSTTQSDYDAARTAHLETRGLRVIRISNEALSEKAVRSLVQDLTRRSPPPRCGEGVRG